MDTSSRLAFSIDEFARLAGIGRTTAYMEVKAGRLRPLKCGRRTLVSAAEAQRWLERLASSHAAAAR
jgi:excisionase family DNA binding protein